ncbi:MAG: ABC transporter permease, partial [Acidobacteriaceae bacterium]
GVAAVFFAWRERPTGTAAASIHGLSCGCESARSLRQECAMDIGLMISSLAMTQQQGLLGVFLFMVPAIVLSGFATPIANMPPLMQYITLIDPLRYFLIIVRGSFLQGGGSSLFWPQYWPLAVIGVIRMMVASRLFRRRLA